MKDIRILDRVLQIGQEGLQLDERLGVLPLYRATRFVGASLQTLDLPDVKDRVKAAALRFRAYVNGQVQGEKPLVLAYQSRLQALLKKYGKKTRYPLKTDLEEYLTNSDKDIAGIQKILEASGDPKALDDLKTFKEQIAAYHQFIKEQILPKARTDARLPVELYRWELRQKGVSWSEKEAITIGHHDYDQSKKEFARLLAQVAEQRKTGKPTVVSVFENLRKDQLTDKDKAEKAFRTEIARQNEIVKSEGLFPFPSTDVQIRMMTAEESQAEPYAHVSPPPLAFAMGESTVFLIPSLAKGAFSIPDFEYQASVPLLVSHEVRPGHELFFNWVLEHGTTMIRARYGYTVPSVEAWAFYAEDVMLKHLPLESQLVWAQMRQWRSARMFLDPELHQGKLNFEQAVHLLTDEVGLSRELSEQEVKRYVESDPAVAVAYAYGYKKLIELKDLVSKKMGKAFSDRCFNEFLLNNALVPIEWLKDYVKEMNCPKPAPKWQDLAAG